MTLCVTRYSNASS